ncbi:glycerol-3-phosphate 1-O-acyltransferase PlsY [Clostridiaceae bacterium NSJ-31]|uniref:Glycerol-3-phosphate acyltransferase n=1 Tax=Ligaoa zhengdingensis TaxID=2763658 RepID=A0A926I048_9FIRM|nr:glycerol-3-phosphate 1-O-acyltransferase PlsY [Ligaoa zhengdingensis]MBC8546617.1 glycerol-3-phosphate 1-O-acyltransferase PlsY [Ligaoa zhengdingensis]
MSNQTTIILAAVLVALCSYLVGSINWSVIISNLFYHKDVRNFGSGNAGMTNMLRTFGKKAAAAVTVGDFSKSIITVAVSRVVFAHLFGQLPFDIGYLAGIFTILGHLFPIYFRFKGGKGVLTALGMMLVIDWRVFLIVLGVGLLILLCCKIVSLASICGAVLYPATYVMVHKLMGDFSLPDMICSIVIALLVIYMHRVNIKRLINGTEYKFGKPKNDKK